MVPDRKQLKSLGHWYWDPSTASYKHIKPEYFRKEEEKPLYEEVPQEYIDKQLTKQEIDTLLELMDKEGHRDRLVDESLHDDDTEIIHRQLDIIEKAIDSE